MSPPGLGWGPVTRCFVHCDEPLASIDVLKYVMSPPGLGWGPVTQCFVHCDEPLASIDVLKCDD